MSFDATWNTLHDRVEEIPSDTTFHTPLSQDTFRVIEVQDGQLLIEYRNSSETVPLQREQFQTLYQNVTEAAEEFDLDRLPPNAEPYATVLSVHPNFELDDHAWTLMKTETSSISPLIETPDEDKNERNRSEQLDPQIQNMLDNMGNPQDEVSCPIDGCGYSHRSASSVARHVSGSDTGKHIWENTSFAGWRDFVRKHGESPG